jgi:threonine/homoserine/homoserine lactone efflux protein
MLVTLVVFNTVGFLAGMIGQTLSKNKTIQPILNKIAGVVFLSLAVKLIMTERNG